MSRVLVVDSDPSVRALAARALRGAGYEAVLAEDAAQGRAALQESRGWALVVCESRGDAVGTIARANAEGVPLVVTGEGAQDTPEGAASFLPRPFTGEGLVDAVRAASASTRTRILVAEDHAAVRASLVAFFEAQDDFQVVGAAENGREAVDLAHELAPHIVLMDIRMPHLDGIEATRMIKAALPETRVVLLSAYEQDDLIEAGVQAGAESFMLKGVPGAELVSVMRGRAA